MHIYIYIYIIYICVCVCVYIYIYIYIYKHMSKILKQLITFCHCSVHQIGIYILLKRLHD